MVKTYCGEYKGFYLRSTYEFAFATYLDTLGITWDYESHNFTLPSGSSYKSDFYLSEFDQLVEIKEYKKSRGLQVATELRTLGIELILLDAGALKMLLASISLDLESVRSVWKNTAEFKQSDVQGERNPRHGSKCSEATKNLIGLKAKERNQDPAYKEKCKISRLNSLKCQKVTELLKTYNDNRKLSRDRIKVCPTCGKKFVLDTYDKAAGNTKYCSLACANRMSFGKKFGKQKQILDIAKAFAKQHSKELSSAKLNKIKPVLQPFYDAIYAATGIKDVRIICESLLGSQANRKLLLKYLQTLSENIVGTNANNEALELENKEFLG